MTRFSARWTGLIAAVLLLNFALSFHNAWPTPWIELRPELSMEAAALIFLMAVYQRFVGTPSDRLIAVLAAVVLLMTLARYMEVTAPALYGRAVNLYWDARYLPDVAAMLIAAVPVYVSIGAVAGLIIGLAAIFLVLRWSLQRVRHAHATGFATPYLARATGALVVLYLLGYYNALPTLQYFSIPVSQTYARQVSFVVNAVTGANALEAALPDDSPLDAIALGDASRGDVIVTFVESYGAVAYDAEPVTAALEPSRRQFAEAIAATGRQVVSAFVTAPTTGGGSWLSHSSFMTGLWIDGPARYDTLLTQQRNTLPKVFASHGYRTLALMPGLKNQWPEGSFYGFDRIYGETALAYTGPAFGWWRIPDQFALAQLEALELSATQRAPVFVFFPTISTHMPFRPTPPYQPDWQRIVTDTPFDRDVLDNGLEGSTEWSQLRPAYSDALTYTYTYWGGYLQEHAERDFLLVLLGDHQPPANVSGEGARWDVPVHVITGEEALLAGLLQRGFVSGLTPEAAPIAQLHELGLILLH